MPLISEPSGRLKHCFVLFSVNVLEVSVSPKVSWPMLNGNTCQRTTMDIHRTKKLALTRERHAPNKLQRVDAI